MHHVKLGQRRYSSRHKCLYARLRVMRRFWAMMVKVAMMMLIELSGTDGVIRFSGHLTATISAKCCTHCAPFSPPCAAGNAAAYRSAPDDARFSEGLSHLFIIVGQTNTMPWYDTAGQATPGFASPGGDIDFRQLYRRTGQQRHLPSGRIGSAYLRR